MQQEVHQREGEVRQIARGEGEVECDATEGCALYESKRER